MSLFAFNVLRASQNAEIARRLPAGVTAFFDSEKTPAPGQIVAIQDGEHVALNVYSDTSAAPVLGVLIYACHPLDLDGDE